MQSIEKPTARIISALLLIASIMLADRAGAQTSFPAREVHIIVGFSAGGTTDIIARLIGHELNAKWGKSVIIEARPGAGGNIGGLAVVTAPPDGYTLFMGSVGPLAINPSLYKAMPFDHLKDFTPVSLVAHVPNMLVVNPDMIPVATFSEFLAEVRKNPGKYFHASTGKGTMAHLSAEMLKKQAGLVMTHVPYKGADAVTDLLASNVCCMFATIPSVIQHVRQGKLRALAVTSRNRSASAPDIPTIAESGFPDFDASSWFGIVGPAGLPKEIAEKVSADIADALKLPALREKLIQQGADPVGNTPAEFAAYMKSETAKWAAAVKDAGVEAE